MTLATITFAGQDVTDPPYWAGLDVGEAVVNVCLAGPDGQLVMEAVCQASSEALDALLTPYKSWLCRVGMETGASLQLVRELCALGYPVAMFDALMVKRFLTVRRNKTDRSDARGIAEVARLGEGIVGHVHVKSLEMQSIQTLLSIRERLVRQRVSSESFVKSILLLYGGKRIATSKLDRLEALVDLEIGSIRLKTGRDLHEDLLPMLQHCRLMHQSIARLDSRLGDLAAAHPACRLFMEIPGVGPLIALSFLASLEDPIRFGRTTDIGAYLGLVPRVAQSGSASRYSRITKMGPVRTRSLLVTAAMCHLRSNTRATALKTWGLAIAARAGRGKARIAVARKLAVIMLSMWKRSERYIAFPNGQTGENE